MRSIVIFGGCGFIGTHLSQHLLSNNLGETIYLVDIQEPRCFGYTQVLQDGLASGRVVYVAHDVRQPIPAGLLPTDVDLIANLAAIHREPGHLAHEYFETNLLGAEHVCAFAEKVNCPTIIFISSISPYGPSEDRKTERSLPMPETPYGSSKLAAEKIHLTWQARSAANKLLILRPGVVFGPGEGGNVTRLVRSLVKGYFVYMGNRETRKAAGYVKELCRVALYGVNLLHTTGESVLLLNFSTDPTPSMETMVETIRKVAGIKREPIRLPRKLLLGISYPIAAIAAALRIQQPISPVRIRKTFRSTNVEAQMLNELGYVRTYTLESAFEDWKSDKPDDFA